MRLFRRRTTVQRDLPADMAERVARAISPLCPLSVAELHQIADWIRTTEAEMTGRICGHVHEHLLNYAMVRGTAGTQSLHAEIGTLFGGGALIAAKALVDAGSDGSFLTIDPLAGYYGETRDPLSGLPVDLATVRANLTRSGLSERVVVVQARSLDASVLSFLERPLSSLWIDGDHSYAGVVADWLRFSPRVRPGGCVLFDNVNDPHWPDVSLAIDSAILPTAPHWKRVAQVDRGLVLQHRQ